MSAQRPSKFDGLLSRRTETPAAAPSTVEKPAIEQTPAEPPPTTIESVPVPRAAAPTPTAPRASTPKTRTKAVAKRGHPDYFNLTVYIRKDTRRAAAIKLAGMADAPEWSELVDNLLSLWVKPQGKKSD